MLSMMSDAADAIKFYKWRMFLKNRISLLYPLSFCIREWLWPWDRGLEWSGLVNITGYDN